MTIKTVLRSHLNDAMLEVNSMPELAILRIKFVNILITYYQDINMEVDEVDEVIVKELWNELVDIHK